MIINNENIVKWRRHFHLNPELSGEEKETSLYIADLLRSFGMQVEEQVGGGYGLVGILLGDPSYKCAALRADMDALPIAEGNSCSYKSLSPGKMHACGHDAHMAMVLGAAQALSLNPPKGSMKFIFQPHEECKPGGAKEMIDAGVLANPHVDGIFATHVNNSFPMGTIAVSDEVMMAASDDFDLIIRGKSGHGAIPHETIDPIAIAAQIITAFHEIVSRRIDPIAPAVLSICSINSGDTYNVIPSVVVLKGTVRCFDLNVRDQIRIEMARIAENICQAWGALADFEYHLGYPPLRNDAEMADRVRCAVGKIDGARISLVSKPPLAGEDFAIFAQQRPSVFFFTGTGSTRCQRLWHNCFFDIEEDALFLGAKVFVSAAKTLADERKEL